MSKLNFFIIYTLILSLFFSCKSGSTTRNQEATETDSNSIDETFIDKKALQTRAVLESSGIVESHAMPQCFWTHNDSGGKSELYLIDDNGVLIHTLKIENTAIKARDWEDICMRYDSVSQKSWIVIGEIGDNRAVYPKKYLYEVEEPSMDVLTASAKSKQKVQRTIEFECADGTRDMECLLYDLYDQSYYIISKREPVVKIFQLNLNQIKQKIRAVGELDQTQIVGGDISKDGQFLLLKNYMFCWLWYRTPQQSLVDCLKKQGTQLPYWAESQGEACCISKKDGENYFYTLSESVAYQHQYLYKYKLKP